MNRLFSPIKIFGGKSYQAKDICKFIKNELSTKKDPVYVEGFLGGANCLLLINVPCIKYGFDIDPLLINCWKVIQEHPNELKEELLKYKYNEETFQIAKEFIQRWELSWETANHLCDKHLLAIQYLIRNRMSRAGQNKDYGWSDRLRRGKPEYISAWETMIDSLPFISKRIREVNFACGDYINLMKKYNLDENPSVCSYIDPPYLHSTRVSKKVYKYEFSNDDHKRLWSFSRMANCTTFISGYLSKEYDDWAAPNLFGNNAEIVMNKSIVNHFSQQKKKPIKNEILWKIG